MSSTNFYNQSSPAPSKRTAQAINEQNTMSSQPTIKKRSLSDRIRNIFRRDASSKSRETSRERTSKSPGRNQTVPSSPQLRAPGFSWSNGKTKNGTTSSKSSKTKRKNEQPSVIEISDPINYRFENDTRIQGENYVPRTPQTAHDNREYIQSSSSYGVRASNTTSRNTVYTNSYDEQIQQVNQSSENTIRPTSYISDGSASPSMHYNRSINHEHEYYFYNEGRPSTGLRSTPVREVVPLPEYQLERRSPVVSTNIDQRRSLSSSALNNTDQSSGTVAFRDNDAPKLTIPQTGFGSTSSKKSRIGKSKSRNNEMSGSTTMISRLVEQNPLNVTRSWTSTYGSLPDAELLDNQPVVTRKPPKKPVNKYPWLSAIVEHHLIRKSPYTIPSVTPTPSKTTGTTTNTGGTTTTTTSTTHPQRFDTSTATADGHDHIVPWNNSSTNAPGSSSIIDTTHDGFIRPLSPDRNSVSTDVGVIRIGVNISAPPMLEDQYRSNQHSESPNVYRSSTTVYTRDRNNMIESGEIRTWPSPQPDLNQRHRETPIIPNILIEIDRVGYEENREPHQGHIVPTKNPYQIDENRYSPRANEQTYPQREDIRRPISRQRDEEDEIHEEHYEVSYEHGKQISKSVYETRTYYADDKFNTRYADIDNQKHLKTYENEHEQTYYHSTLTPNDAQYFKESYNRTSPSDFTRTSNFHTFNLKRYDNYDGLGILIATDAQTRSLHFIRDVEVGSPGARAGLRKDDRIISVNDTNVENMDFDDVLLLIKQGLDDNNLQIAVMRELDST